MNNGDPLKPAVALIAGPTASGKSALALDFAARTGGVIVNADASQVYRDLRVLTARPSPADEARAEHRLFGHVDGAHACSAAEWAADARPAITDIHAAGRLPILVGGTGLYIRTLLDGIAPVPDIDPAIRAAARALPVAEAYEALIVEDPAAAAILNPGDTTRVIRALEVVRSTGRPIAAWRAEKAGGIGEAIRLHAVILDPPRAWLHARGDARVNQMIAAGAVNEVELLSRRCLDLELPVMRAIGVRPLLDHLNGTLSLEDAADQIRLDTRKYVKRQTTWMRHQFDASWLRIDPSVDNSDRIFANVNQYH
jgi:tRNA dimethylallyltransferase